MAFQEAVEAAMKDMIRPEDRNARGVIQAIVQRMAEYNDHAGAFDTIAHAAEIADTEDKNGMVKLLAYQQAGKALIEAIHFELRNEYEKEWEI